MNKPSRCHHKVGHIAGLLLCLLQPACTTIGKLGQVIMDPDIRVGSQNDQASTLGISLLADPDTNPGPDRQARPVTLQLIWLAEESRLLASDYQELGEDPAKALGKNYLDHQEFTLLPGQFRYLPATSLPEQTRYVAVIAQFVDIHAARWRNVIKVAPRGHSYQLLVQLQSNAVVLQKDEE
jgi:type VI secretion system protein VasD